MMNYEQFKEEMKEKFLRHMPLEYQRYEVVLNEVEKTNRILDGLFLRNMSGSTVVSPNIYLNDFYEMYRETGDFDAVITKAAEVMEKAFKKVPEVGSLDYADARNSIVFYLINTAQNAKMLENVPHREYQDLSIIYRWVVKQDEQGIQSILINNDLAARMGMNEEQLWKEAVVNTKELMPPVVENMNEIMRKLVISEGMPPELADMMVPGDVPADQTLWVITNERGLNGAASMLYEENLHTLAEKIGTDLYILPSSIHEVIAVSCEMGSPLELAAMVNEVNMGQVALEDRLSNQVYHYDKDARKLSLATDTPNKRLDMDQDSRKHEPDIRVIHGGAR